MTRTKAQGAAIASDSSKIIVLAGPGSGKTSTLVGRIDRLIADGVDPERIATITFTNAAARELESRLQARLGYCGTLHGFALRSLRRHGGDAGYGARISVVNPEGSEALLRSSLRTVANDKVPMKRVLEAKAAGLPERPSTPAELVLAHYAEGLRSAGIVDFDCLLTEFARLLLENRGFSALGGGLAAEFDYVLIDEVQDSSPIDWAIYRALPIVGKYLVGDPDQSIYGFRGAALTELLEAVSSGEWELHKLEENFRSFTAVTAAAQRLIEHNRERPAKRTVSARGVGGRVAAAELSNPGEESARIASLVKMELVGRRPEDLAVLTRTNETASALAKELAAAGIPVAARVDANLPRDLARARALASYLCNPENDTLGFLYTAAVLEDDRRAHDLANEAATLRKSINAHAYGFGRGLPASEYARHAAMTGISAEARMFAAEKFRNLPEDAPMVELAAALGAGAEFDAARSLAKEGVRVLTVHSAKGLEFDTVFLAGFEDEAIPGRRKDVDLEEERRLAYVAITRAKRVVQFTSARIRNTKWGGLEPRTPSRFIAEAITEKP